MSSRRTSREAEQWIEVDGISIHLVRKPVRRLSLRVLAPEGTVRLTVPLTVSNTRARHFAAEHIAWITQQQRRIQSAPPAPTASTGDRYWFGGSQLTLSVVERPGPTEVQVTGGELVLHISTGTTTLQRARALENFFRGQLQSELEHLVPKYSQLLGLYPASWQVRKMRTRWGSCTHNTKTIRFALALVEVPQSCVEYVVVHELAHLAHPNHSAAFWGLVSRHLPDWRAARAHLRTHRTP